jgi:Mu transposase, C-terminal.
MTRLEVWNESIAEVGQKTTTMDNLALMLMRSTRPQKVGRQGVYVSICGEKLHYWDEETILKYQGREVYVRYDPADLSSVRIYDAQTDTYLQTAPMALETMLLFQDSAENISIAQERFVR